MKPPVIGREKFYRLSQKKVRLSRQMQFNQLKFKFQVCLISLTLLLFGVRDLYSQRELKGNILTDGEITIGASIYVKDTLIFTLSDINGEFRLEKLPNNDFILVINPCCTCYNSTEVKIEKEITEIEISCNCKKSKATIVKRYLAKGELKEKRKRIKIK